MYLKIYGSVDKVFVKDYIIDKNSVDILLNSSLLLTKNHIIAIKNRIYSKLFFSNGLCGFLYDIDRWCIQRAIKDKEYFNKLFVIKN